MKQFMSARADWQCLNPCWRTMYYLTGSLMARKSLTKNNRSLLFKSKRKRWMSNCIIAILVSLHNKCKVYNNWLCSNKVPSKKQVENTARMSLGRKISYQLQRVKYRHVTNMVGLVSTGPFFTRHSLQSQFL